MIQEAIARLLDGQHLARDEARSVMYEIMSGEATLAQIAGFLVALRAKGETVAEIAGCGARRRCGTTRCRCGRSGAISWTRPGRGGDGARTINISTAAGIVAAAAPLVDRARRSTSVPLYAGFGISTAAHAAAAAELADGIVVGSAALQAAAEGASGLERFVSSLRTAIG